MYVLEPDCWLSAELLPLGLEVDLSHCWLADAAAVLASKSLLPLGAPPLPSSMLGSTAPVKGREPEPSVAICCRCCALLLGRLNTLAKPCHLPGLACGAPAVGTPVAPSLEKLVSGLGTCHVAALTTGNLLD